MAGVADQCGPLAALTSRQKKGLQRDQTESTAPPRLQTRTRSHTHTLTHTHTHTELQACAVTTHSFISAGMVECDRASFPSTQLHTQAPCAFTSPPLKSKR